LVHPLLQRGLRSRVERDVQGSISFDDANRHRKVEAPRTRARRIKEAHAVDYFVVRQVTVTEYDDIGRPSGKRGPNRRAQLAGPRKNVGEKNPQAANLEANDLQSVRVIIVPTHERDRSNLLQVRDHGIVADVAGMENVIDAAERSERFGSNQTVRVRDDTDSRRAASGEPRAGGSCSPLAARRSLIPKLTRVSPNSCLDIAP
jgi:hypothetical protein